LLLLAQPTVVGVLLFLHLVLHTVKQQIHSFFRLVLEVELKGLSIVLASDFGNGKDGAVLVARRLNFWHNLANFDKHVLKRALMRQACVVERCREDQ